MSATAHGASPAAEPPSAAPSSAPAEAPTERSFGPDVLVFRFELPAAADADDSAAAAPALPPRSLSIPVKETSFDDGGLGWRVWGAARVLTHELAAAPPAFLARATVLEIGAGCGLCGFAVSALGAPHVTLTDALPGLLRTLAASASLQAPGADVAAAAAAAETTATWDWPGAMPGSVLRVRSLLWDDDGAAGAASAEDAAFKRSMLAGQLRRLAARDGTAAPNLLAPPLAADETFDVVIGSDLLYDWGQLGPLARCVLRRLAPGGVALLALPVRDKPLLDAFCVRLTQEGLAWDARPSPARSRPPARPGGDEPLACVDLRAWRPDAPPAERWRGWPEDTPDGCDT